MNSSVTGRGKDEVAHSRTRHGIVTAAALVIIVAGMRAAATLLLPLLVSTFIALICAPALFWLKRKGLPSVLAVFVVVMGLLVIGVLVVMMVGSSLGDFYKALPVYQERLQGQVTAATGWLQRQGLELPGGVISDFIAPGAVMQLAATILSNVGGLITNTFVILVTTIFMLLEASTIPVKLRAVIKNPEASFARFATIADNVNRYLAIKTLVSLATGVTVSIWLLVLGVDFAVLWGLLAFLLNYIPNIGSIIADFRRRCWHSCKLVPAARF